MAPSLPSTFAASQSPVYSSSIPAMPRSRPISRATSPRARSPIPPRPIYMESVHPLPTRRSRDHASPRSPRSPRPTKRSRTAASQSIPPLRPPLPPVRSSSPRPPTPTQRVAHNFLYCPNRHLNSQKLLESASVSPSLSPSNLHLDVVVHIYAEYLTTSNPAISNRLLWGTDQYTDDSDLVAVLLHTGHHFPTPTKSTIFDFLSVRVRLIPHQSRVSPPFAPSTRNGLRSRSWPDVFNGARLQVQNVTMVTTDRAIPPPPIPRPFEVPVPPNLLHPLPPTSSANWQPPPDRETHRKVSLVRTLMSTDLSNRPCLVYDMKHVSSVNRNSHRLPLARLMKDALYVEDAQQRFEVSLIQNRSGKIPSSSLVRFARVKDAIIKSQLLDLNANPRHKKIPLHEEDVEVLHTIGWQHVHWHSTGVSIGGQDYALSKLAFRKRMD